MKPPTTDSTTFRKPWARIELHLLSQRTLMLGQDCNHEWTTLGEMRLICERASEKVAVTSRNQKRPWTTMRLSRGCDRLTNRRRWNRPMVTRCDGRRQCCRFFILSCFCLCWADYQLYVLLNFWQVAYSKTSRRLRRGCGHLELWISV